MRNEKENKATLYPTNMVREKEPKQKSYPDYTKPAIKTGVYVWEGKFEGFIENAIVANPQGFSIALAIIVIYFTFIR